MNSWEDQVTAAPPVASGPMASCSQSVSLLEGCQSFQVVTTNAVLEAIDGPAPSLSQKAGRERND
jgi:hypothetical protein